MRARGLHLMGHLANHLAKGKLSLLWNLEFLKDAPLVILALECAEQLS